VRSLPCFLRADLGYAGACRGDEVSIGLHDAVSVPLPQVGLVRKIGTVDPRCVRASGGSLRSYEDGSAAGSMG
jgi:hypothetical protein